MEANSKGGLRLYFESFPGGGLKHPHLELGEMQVARLTAGVIPLR
jgi:hypothetical protein